MEKRAHRMIERVRPAMSRLTPQFSANRVVREYVETHYLARAKAYCDRTSNLAQVQELMQWRQALEENWGRVRFGEVDVASDGGEHRFNVQVYLNGLDPESVRVQLYADAKDGGGAEIRDMERCSPLVGASNAHCYTASVPATRPAGDYTPRIIPHHTLAAMPLECSQILWYR